LTILKIWILSIFKQIKSRNIPSCFDLIQSSKIQEMYFIGAVFDGLSQRIEEEVPRPSRKELEKEAAMGMLSVRATEMRVAWQKNRYVIVRFSFLNH